MFITLSVDQCSGGFVVKFRNEAMDGVNRTAVAKSRDEVLEMLVDRIKAEIRANLPENVSAANLLEGIAA